MQSISFSSFLALLHTSEILQTTATHVTGKAWSSFCYVASQIKSTSEDSWYDQIWSSPSRTHLKNNQKRGGQQHTSTTTWFCWIWLPPMKPVSLPADSYSHLIRQVCLILTDTKHLSPFLPKLSILRLYDHTNHSFDPAKAQKKGNWMKME